MTRKLRGGAPRAGKMEEFRRMLAEAAKQKQAKDAAKPYSQRMIEQGRCFVCTMRVDQCLCEPN